MNKKLFKLPVHFFFGSSISPWPFLSGFMIFSLVLCSLGFFHFISMSWMLLFISVLLLFVMFSWWFNVCEEGSLGYHSMGVQNSLRFGVMLFMFSEVMFFFSFFWAYFDMCWTSAIELGFVFPPVNFDNMLVDPYSVPLFNSVVLLSSGVFVTWCHNNLIYGGNYFNLSLFLTVVLGLIFLINQLLEYSHSYFKFNSLSYGSCFYILTGFHGFHVLVGTSFLIFCLFRSLKDHFSSNHHLGLEFAMWYWHFVDVVWLFLYVSIYWYGYLL